MLPWQGVHLCIQRWPSEKCKSADCSSKSNKLAELSYKTIRVYQGQRRQTTEIYRIHVSKEREKEIPFWYLCLGG